MKKISMWETNDGARFKHKVDGEKHEAMMLLIKEYNNNVLVTQYDEQEVSFDQFYGWLKDNKDLISDIYTFIEK